MDKPRCLEVQLATSSEHIRSCYGIAHELRPHLTSEKAFIEQVQRQMVEGYRLVYIQEEGKVKALAGYRFLELLAWGNVLYIDDLVSGTTARKKGYGTKILKWLIEEAKKAACDQVHLDSGPHRHDAHRLYLNNGFKIIAQHFALDLKKTD